MMKRSKVSKIFGRSKVRQKVNRFVRSSDEDDEQQNYQFSFPIKRGIAKRRRGSKFKIPRPRSKTSKHFIPMFRSKRGYYGQEEDETEFSSFDSEDTNSISSSDFSDSTISESSQNQKVQLSQEQLKQITDTISHTMLHSFACGKHIGKLHLEEQKSCCLMQIIETFINERQRKLDLKKEKTKIKTVRSGTPAMRPKTISKTSRQSSLTNSKKYQTKQVNDVSKQPISPPSKSDQIVSNIKDNLEKKSQLKVFVKDSEQKSKIQEPEKSEVFTKKIILEQKTDAIQKQLNQSKEAIVPPTVPPVKDIPVPANKAMPPPIDKRIRQPSQQNVSKNDPKLPEKQPHPSVAVPSQQKLQAPITKSKLNLTVPVQATQKVKQQPVPPAGPVAKVPMIQKTQKQAAPVQKGPEVKIQQIPPPSIQRVPQQQPQTKQIIEPIIQKFPPEECSTQIHPFPSDGQKQEAVTSQVEQQPKSQPANFTIVAPTYDIGTAPEAEITVETNFNLQQNLTADSTFSSMQSTTEDQGPSTTG